TGVPVRALLLQLLTGQRDLVGVHDDHEVAGVDVGRVIGLVLAPKQRGNLARHTPEHVIGSVDNVPLTLDIARFGAVCAHDRLPSLFSRLPHPRRDGGLVYGTSPRARGRELPAAAGPSLGRMSHANSGRLR